jgi:hypothetical protein
MTIQESFRLDDTELNAVIKLRYSEYERINGQWVGKDRLEQLLKWANDAYDKAMALDQFLRGSPDVDVCEDGEVTWF